MAKPTVRILCIDGGGIRGAAPLRILQDLCDIETRQPYQMFDVICGTSTGGLIAILLGMLKMDINKVVELYRDIGNQVFPYKGYISKLSGYFWNGEMYSSDNLKEIIIDQLALSLFNFPVDKEKLEKAENLKMSDFPGPGNEQPYVFVVANRNNSPYFFRNYKYGYQNTDKSVGTDQVKIWEAIRATTAAPTYFKHIQIRIGSADFKFVDGGVGPWSALSVGPVGPWPYQTLWW